MFESGCFLKNSKNKVVLRIRILINIEPGERNMVLSEMTKLCVYATERHTRVVYFLVSTMCMFQAICLLRQWLELKSNDIHSTPVIRPIGNGQLSVR